MIRKINPNFCCWWPETAPLPWPQVPSSTHACLELCCVKVTAGAFVPGLCVSTSWYNDSLHRNTLSQVQSICSLYYIPSAWPRWELWLAGDPWVCWGQGGCLCGREGKGRAHQENARGTVYQGHSTQGAQGCTRLSCQGLPAPTFP